MAHRNHNKKLSSPSTCKPLHTPPCIPKPTQCEGHSNVQSSIEKGVETTDRFEGFSTAGGRKFTVKNDALLKAKSLLEVDTVNELEGTVPNRQYKLNPEKIADAPKVDYSQSKSNLKLSSEGSMGKFSECGAGFQGFHTASGKKVEFSESSLKKAQMIISEEGDAKEFPDTECANISDLLPSGDRKAAKIMSETPSMNFSGGRKRPHPGENVAITAKHSGNVRDKNFKGKGKNIFLDIFEEFEGCSELSSDSLTGFKTADGNNICSVKFTKEIANPTEVKAVSTNIQGIEKNSADIREEEIVKKVFSGIRKKGINSELRQGILDHSIQPERAGQQMKSSSIAAKFPQGSYIPKGFRPFKAPKIVAKPKLEDFTLAKTSIVIPKPMANDTGLPETVELNSRIPVSVKSSTHAKSSEVSTGDVKTEKTLDETECDVKVTGETSSENADMSNLFLNEMFDDEMEISQKSECTVNRKISDVKRIKVFVDREEPTSSEGDVKNSMESNVTEQNLEASVRMIDFKPNFSGFQTASGKTVNIDEKSLKKAKELWESQANLSAATGSFDDSDPEVTFKNKEVHLLSTTVLRDAEGKREELCQRAKKSINDEILPGAAFMDEDQERTIRKEFYGFQTAAGKIVNVDEQSLSEAKELWEKSLRDDCSRPEHKDSTSETFQGFHAASGKPHSAKDDPKLGEKSHDLPSSEKIDQPTRIDGLERDVKFCGFQTASGKQVKVSENALSEANKLWENSSANGAQSLISDGEPCKDKLSIEGFQTASGNIVKVDEKSITEARKLWTSADLENSENLPQSVLENLFQPDNFSQVSMKDMDPSEDQASGETLKMTSAITETPQSVPRLANSDSRKSTASSTDIPYKMQRTAEKEIENEYTQPSFVPNASNKGIHGSNQTLDNKTADTSAPGDKKGTVKSLSGNDKAKSNGQVLSSSTCPFMSASGKQISVSSSALESTKSFFSEIDESVDLNTSESECKSFSPFQSASGKSVSVSQKSLEKARAVFADNPEMETSHCVSSTDTKLKVKEDSFLPFQSASGGNVSVSQKALEMARDKLAENFSKEQAPKPKFLNNDRMNSGVSPFQSASGKSVKVCKSSLDRARARLAENLDGNGDNPLTSCNKGPGVVPRVNTQKRKLEDIKTPKKQTDRVSGDVREYENLVLPDDFFDEMETPNKKMKINPDVKCTKKQSGMYCFLLS